MIYIYKTLYISEGIFTKWNNSCNYHTFLLARAKPPYAPCSYYRFLKDNHYLDFFPYWLSFPASNMYITLYE